MQDTLQESVAASKAAITVFTGTWQHDVDQAELLKHHKHVRIKVRDWETDGLNTDTSRYVICDTVLWYIEVEGSALPHMVVPLCFAGCSAPHYPTLICRGALACGVVPLACRTALHLL